MVKSPKEELSWKRLFHSSSTYFRTLGGVAYADTHSAVQRILLVGHYSKEEKKHGGTASEAIHHRHAYKAHPAALDVLVLNLPNVQWHRAESFGESPIVNDFVSCVIVGDTMQCFWRARIPQQEVTGLHSVLAVTQLDLSTMEWTTSVPAKAPTGYHPPMRKGFSCCNIPNSSMVVLFGGHTDEKLCNATVMYDTLKKQYSEFNTYGDIPPASEGHSYCMYELPSSAERMSWDVQWFSARLEGKSLFVFGGVTTGKQVNNTLYCLSLQTHFWTRLRTAGVLPSPRAFGAVCIANRMNGNPSMCLVGGRDESKCFGDTFVLDVQALTWQGVYESSFINMRGGVTISIGTEFERRSHQIMHCFETRGMKVWMVGGSGYESIFCHDIFDIWCLETTESPAEPSTTQELEVESATLDRMDTGMFGGSDGAHGNVSPNSLLAISQSVLVTPNTTTKVEPPIAIASSSPKPPDTQEGLVALAEQEAATLHKRLSTHPLYAIRERMIREQERRMAIEQNLLLKKLEEERQHQKSEVLKAHEQLVRERELWKAHYFNAEQNIAEEIKTNYEEVRRMMYEMDEETTKKEERHVQERYREMEKARDDVLRLFQDESDMNKSTFNQEVENINWQRHFFASLFHERRAGEERLQKERLAAEQLALQQRLQEEAEDRGKWETSLSTKASYYQERVTKYFRQHRDTLKKQQTEIWSTITKEFEDVRNGFEKELMQRRINEIEERKHRWDEFIRRMDVLDNAQTKETKTAHDRVLESRSKLESEGMITEFKKLCKDMVEKNKKMNEDMHTLSERIRSGQEIHSMEMEACRNHIKQIKDWLRGSIHEVREDTVKRAMKLEELQSALTSLDVRQKSEALQRQANELRFIVEECSRDFNRLRSKEIDFVGRLDDMQGILAVTHNELEGQSAIHIRNLAKSVAPTTHSITTREKLYSEIWLKAESQKHVDDLNQETLSHKIQELQNDQQSLAVNLSSLIEANRTEMMKSREQIISRESKINEKLLSVYTGLVEHKKEDEHMKSTVQTIRAQNTAMLRVQDDLIHEVRTLAERLAEEFGRRDARKEWEVLRTSTLQHAGGYELSDISDDQSLLMASTPNLPTSSPSSPPRIFVPLQGDVSSSPTTAPHHRRGRLPDSSDANDSKNSVLDDSTAESRSETPVRKVTTRVSMVSHASPNLRPGGRQSSATRRDEPQDSRTRRSHTGSELTDLDMESSPDSIVKSQARASDRAGAHTAPSASARATRITSVSRAKPSDSIMEPSSVSAYPDDRQVKKPDGRHSPLGSTHHSPAAGSPRGSTRAPIGDPVLGSQSESPRYWKINNSSPRQEGVNDSLLQTPVYGEASGIWTPVRELTSTQQEAVRNLESLLDRLLVSEQRLGEMLAKQSSTEIMEVRANSRVLILNALLQKITNQYNAGVDAINRLALQREKVEMEGTLEELEEAETQRIQGEEDVRSLLHQIKIVKFVLNREQSALDEIELGMSPKLHNLQRNLMERLVTEDRETARRLEEQEEETTNQLKSELRKLQEERQKLALEKSPIMMHRFYSPFSASPIQQQA